VTFHVSTLDYSALPEWAREGLRLYVEEHVEPGSGLRACLQNDLREAITRVTTRQRSWALSGVSWLYNEAPGPCWGSKDKVVAWLGARTV
jgi:hypothetical protein